MIKEVSTYCGVAGTVKNPLVVLESSMPMVAGTVKNPLVVLI